MAPSYANIFMGELEENLLQQTSNRPAIWWRFIDDIFAIWTHGEDNLNTFLREINSFHETIKFTAEWSKEIVSFLDTTVFINESGIHTDLYTKPTDTHQYLMPTSCHPKHCTNSIPYSQSLRCRRICSNEEDFQMRVRELKQHLLTRGYNEELVDRQMERAIIIPRENTLQNHQRQTSMGIQRLPLVITYHPGLPNILKKHLPILHASDRLRDAVPDPPMVAFRRPKNLRDLLVWAELKNSGPPSTQTGNYQCKDKRCHAIHVKSSLKKHIHKQNKWSKAQCEQTRNLVYLIQCKKCGLQYIGETENPLHIRINGHRSDINTRKTEKPVAAHFNQPDHCLQDLQVMGIEKIHTNDTTRRKLIESYWIFTKETLTPSGMNVDE